MLEWLKVIGPLLISWPVVGLVIALIFRRPLLSVIDRLIRSDKGAIEVASVRVELGRLASEGQDAVNDLHRINVVLAESRLLELQITEGMFGLVFSDEQREQMNKHIEELKRLTVSDPHTI